jgi:hypothetical protein
MKSIKTIKKQAIKAAQLSFKNGELDEAAARKFIKAFKGLPLGESILTLSQYMKALRSGINKTTLTVESVVSIPKSEIKELQNVLGRQYKVLETKEELNPSLLGGIKVRIGDVIFDNSLKSRISQVKEALVN